MKMKTKLLLLGTIVIVNSVFAQCPPPGLPSPGATCVTAPILCADLNGYCGSLNASHPPTPFPGCPVSFILNNEIWVGFIAGTSSIAIEVTPSNCIPGPNIGLQGGIYSNCSPPWTIMDLQCSCTTNPFVLSATNFVIGQIYWLMLDGCAGNNCNYSIQVISGSTMQIPPNNPGPISGPSNVCTDSSSTYSIVPPTGATIYNWTLNPALGTITGTPNNEVTINWGTISGLATLCVSVENVCLSNPVESCLQINVTLPGDSPQISGISNICPSNQIQPYSVLNPQSGVSYSWTVPPGCTFSGSGTNIVVDFSGMIPGSGNICVTVLGTCNDPTSCIAVDYSLEPNITWTGQYHIWSLPQNWNLGYVPLPCNNINIPLGFVLVTNELPALGKTLEVQLGARLEVPLGSTMAIE